MNVVQVKFKCATGTHKRYMASIMTPFVVVTVIGFTHIDAIIRCLKEFNSRVFYDPTFNSK